ncbi:unnamed protein product, partial [Adineta ricciae]
LQQETAYQPSEQQVNVLRQLNSISLSCPCTKISLPYNIFVSVEPRYHQICSSAFVNTSWMTFITFYAAPAALPLEDARITAVGFFQMLHTLCTFAQQTIDDSKHIFLQTQLISTELYEQSLLESKVEVAIRDWQATTINAFTRDQQLIQNVVQGNQIMAGFLSNFYFNFGPDNQLQPFSFPVHTQRLRKEVDTLCLCALDQRCAWHSFTLFIDNNSSSAFYVPGMFSGCYLVNSILQSTLECFYNQTCLNTFQVTFGGSNNDPRFPILDSSLNLMNESIGSIVSRLMVESWKTNIDFSAYFNACALSFCTYEYTQFHSLAYLITMIVGVFGGLTRGLCFFIPILIKVYSKIRSRHVSPRKTRRQRLRLMLNFIASFNLFRRVNSNDVQLQIQRQMTRFYVIILVTALSAVFLFIALPFHKEIVSLSSPSSDEYQRLYNRTINLQCVCSRVAIPYSSFLSLKQPLYHQVCSSDFISQKWISRMFAPSINQYLADTVTKNALHYNVTQYPPTDYRAIATYHFQLLAAFCRLVNSTVDATLKQLATQHFVNAFLLASADFDMQITVLMKQLTQMMSSTFVQSLHLIRVAMHTNALFTITASNWQFTPSNPTPYFTVRTEPVIYNQSTTSCSCALTPSCTQPATIDNVTLPGVMVGCFPVESLLQSSLDLLYNQTLVDLLSSGTNDTFVALNRTSASRYQPDVTTVDTILSQLMIEEWEPVVNSTSYDLYFAQCSPSSCTFSNIKRRSLVATSTDLIAFAGGFSIILNILIPFLIKTLYFNRQRRNQTQSTNEP